MAQALPDPREAGELGVFHLKRIWASYAGDGPASRDAEWPLDQVVLYGLNLALEETAGYLAGAKPTFPAFEAWVLARNAGGLDRAQVARINAAVARVFGFGESCAVATPRATASVRDTILSAEDHAHFAEHGYLVLRQAVPRTQALSAAAALCRHLGIDPDAPGTWYESRTHGIMMQLFHHEALDAHRASPRIRRAFAELYGSDDLWMTVDRVSFNPPERDGWRFPGPHLHWDADISVRPMPLVTQGILYLSDTPAHHGAFACVPGFHHRIDAWLEGRRSASYPQGEELGGIAPTPVPGEAGDLVIWHQALPHAATPNVGTRPRIVHYVNMVPTPPCLVPAASPAAA